MNGLSDNWFLEPVFDFEYKSYEVLGYSKILTEQFSNWRFYPYIEDLTRHLQRLENYLRAKDELEAALHRTISEIDLENRKIIKSPVDDPKGVVGELQEIISFACKHFNTNLKNAASELAILSKEIKIQQLGISDLSLDRGILLFRRPTHTRVYNYSLRLIQRPGNLNSHKDLKTNYVQDYSTGLFTNFNEVKWSVLKEAGMEKGSNAFLIETSKDLPHYELVLPVVKKHLIELSR